MTKRASQAEGISLAIRYVSVMDICLNRIGPLGRVLVSIAMLIAFLLLQLGCPSNSSNSNSDSGSAGPPPPAPTHSLDLAQPATVSAGLLRVYGSTGSGAQGVAVAGGQDVDGDGHPDLLLAAMRARPGDRNNAGEVFLVFGDGTPSGSRDTAVRDARILVIRGAAAFENAGNVVWIDDVTGDGLGDILIARQNFTPFGASTGAGAVTIIQGGPELATFASTLSPFDLARPSASIHIVTLVGRERLGRFGIWLRTGDVTGDGVADVLVGADQEDSNGEADSGAAYLIRGGSHLAGPVSLTVNLASFGATALAGHIAKILPPTGSTEFHFGGTCQIADLDNNNRGEVMIAATIHRDGATLSAGNNLQASAHGMSGAPGGGLYIAWDDNFLDNPWTPGFTISIDNTAPGSTTTIRGGATSVAFGEEILGGRDFDLDGFADLFVGDLASDATLDQSRAGSGSGHLLYHAEMLRGAAPFSLDAPPASLNQTTFIGAAANDQLADAAIEGDFDVDGSPDLAFSAPHASANGRSEAGIVYIVHGQTGPFPSRVDLRSDLQPAPSMIRISHILGAKSMDVLGSSAEGGDHDGDGIDDLILNEMLGDGLLPAATDVGNLIVVSGTLIRDLP